jgi:hypothetical protein
VAAVIAVAAAWLLGRDPQGLVSRDWNGLAFVATSLTIAMVVLSIFLGLYPRVMVSTLGSANDLTVANTASPSYTLRVMTVVAVILLPVVLAYQGWTYYVFRRRIGRSDVSALPTRSPDTGTTRGYCLAMAMWSRSSGVIRWSRSSAASPRSIWTQRIRPLKRLSPGP